MKELEALPLKQRRRIARTLRALAASPRPQGCEKLAGSELFRIRQGDHRVLYEVTDEARTVMVIRIGHHRGVYQ